MVRKALQTAIFVMFCLWPSDLQAVPDRPPVELPAPKANRTVIPGTWAWSVETNKLGKLDGSDLWWSPQTDTLRHLVPFNGAAISIVAEPFEKIDLTYLKSVELMKGKLAGSGNNFLPPGTVLAVRTANGNFAKLKVVRYYTMQDFAFPGTRFCPSPGNSLHCEHPIENTTTSNSSGFCTRSSHAEPTRS